MKQRRKKEKRIKRNEDNFRDLWDNDKLPNIRIMKVKVKSLSRVRLFETLGLVRHQAPLSMGFPRQEYWSGLLFPSPGDLPDPGIEPWSPVLQAASLPSELLGKSEVHCSTTYKSRKKD